jgi:AcrR family transcriptional regulator
MAETSNLNADASPSRRLAPAPTTARNSPFGRVLSTDERKYLVIEAAARLFESKSFHGTSIQQIADEIGVTKAAIYHYVDSKEQMLYEIHDTFITTLLEDATTFVAGEDDPAKQLQFFIRSIFSVVADYRPYVRAFFGDFSNLSSEWRAQIKDKRDRYEQLVEHSLEVGIDRGIFDLPMSPRLGALFVFGACNWSYQWMETDGDSTPDELADIWFQVHMKAFGPGAQANA